MSHTDPHIHVDVKLHADVDVRNVTAGAFGLVGSLPARAATGCGIEVPYAMTSTRPQTVTCLPCREYAHRRYLELAASIEEFAGVTPELGRRSAAAAVEYRALARRFVGGG